MITIVFIHQGDSAEIRYSLAQARKSSPHCRIVLLGDSRNRRYRFVEHHELKDYLDDSLRPHYLHLSNNSFEGELFCLTRWFALRNFMERWNLTKVIYLDSDVLLYHDISTEEPRLQTCEMTVTKGIGPQYTYFESSEVVRNFCSFIMSHYTDQTKLSELRGERETYRQADGSYTWGISDMTFLGKYGRSGLVSVIDLFLPHERGFYDENVGQSYGYEMDQTLNIKRIYDIGGRYHVKQIGSGEYHVLRGEHFQGNNKRYLSKYYTGSRTLWITSHEVLELLRGLRATLRFLLSHLKNLFSRSR